MNQEDSRKAEKSGKSQNAPPDDDSAGFGSNAVRLSARDWVIAASLVLLVFILTPIIWKRIERFESQTDFRIPFELNDDYWTYEQLDEAAAERDRILVIGDSVVWGEYVDPQHTLSHFLNEAHGRPRFANGGLNGTHPLALHGLVENYVGVANDRHVIVHCNLLWMSSKDRDLQTDKDLEFNHPRLVPQFVPWIPSYKAPVDERIGIVSDNVTAYRKWTNHLRVAYFDSLDVPTWTLENPYKNPIQQIRLEIPKPKNEPHSPPISWTEKGIPVEDFPWINLDTSLQWQAFRTTVETLRARGNKVFVIVGPFNEHLLTAASRKRYHAMKQRANTWLSDNGVPHYTAALLPSHEYGDASHPLSAGYARLAKQLFAREAFQRWLSD